jgi:hypothetical protein
MGQYWQKPNHNMVGEYQGSGMPFVTSSQVAEVTAAGNPIRIHFPGVTRWFEVRNTGTGHLKVGFTSNGVQSLGATTGSIFPSVQKATAKDNIADHTNYFLLQSGSSTGRWELKTDQIWLDHGGDGATDFSVIAGITNIPKDQYVILSGAEGFGGVG